MISYSYSFIHRNKCKYCFSAPVKYRTYKKISTPGKELFKFLEYNNAANKFIDISQIALMEDIVRFRHNDTIKIMYFNISTSAFRFLNPVAHRRDKKYIDHGQFKHYAKIASCRCGSSYWLDHSLNDPNYLAESNITSNLKFSLKLIKRNF